MITQELLKELLEYNSETGIFTWKKFQNGRAVSGSVAGCVSGGYVHIKVCKERFTAHRLAWLYMTGSFPSGHIDHIDMDRSNNRIVNLRDSTRSENGQNRVRAQSNNSSGFLGVYKKKNSKKWCAQIVVSKKNKFLGVFDTAEEASKAYLNAKRNMHPFGML